ncbi:hypothetical protein GN956_G4903 [Arapaima gigas]
MRAELPFLLPSVEPGALRTMDLPAAARLPLAHLWALSLLAEASRGGLSFVHLACEGAAVSELSSVPDVHTLVPGTEAVPAFKQSPEMVKVTEGEDVTFSCLLKGAFPTEAEVQWHHRGPHGDQTVLKGNQTEADSFAGRVFLSGDLGVGDASMTLLNVSLEDSGVFLCLLAARNATVLQGSGTRLSVLQKQVCWHHCGRGCSSRRGRAGVCSNRPDTVPQEAQLPSEVRKSPLQVEVTASSYTPPHPSPGHLSHTDGCSLWPRPLRQHLLQPPSEVCDRCSGPVAGHLQNCCDKCYRSLLTHCPQITS